MHSDALIPSGSVTKPWTAVAILQMVESGKINLNTPVHLAIDPVLQRSWHTTLFDLFDQQPNIKRVRCQYLDLTAAFLCPLPLPCPPRLTPPCGR